MASFGSSYIKTTSASATRNADVASMTGTNFSSWFNNAEGAVYAEAQSSFLPVSGEVGVFRINNGAGTGNEIRIRYVDRNIAGQVSASGSETFNQNIPAVNLTFYKIALAYKANDSVFSANGFTASTDSSVTIPSGLTIARFGSSSTGVGGGFLNGTIRRIAYYPQRLANAQLVALTG